jgi:ABC-type amino acid transport substrate-binding protein
MTRSRWFRRTGAVVLAAAVVGAAVGAGASARTQATSNPYNLITPGTLTVGMTLQFKPEMYLQNGKPAGYDVELLDALAKKMGVQLKIDNLAFTGLIAGLVAKKFDMVSVGLSPTPAREKSVTFSRAYVPYALILAVPVNTKTPATIAAWNSSSQTITALQGSTDQQLAEQMFPKAKVVGYSDDTTALLQVATGRATAAVVEDYILAEFSKSNPGKLKQAAFAKPLNVQYGSYAVQKGNTALATYLNSFICGEQKNGGLAMIYKATEGAPLPPMPAC